MQKKLKYMLLTFLMAFFTSISVANPLSYIFAIDKGDNYLKGFFINQDGIITLKYFNSTISAWKPNSIVISPDGKYAFISSELNTVYECIRYPDGTINNCGSSGIFFNNPQGMAFDKLGHIYITNKGDSSVSVCDFYKDYGIIQNCHYAIIKDPNFVAPTNIAISQDGKYAYITMPEVKSISICKIENTLFSGCVPMSNAAFIKPTALAISPYYYHLYVIDIANNTGITCELLSGGSQLGSCRSTSFNNYQTLSGAIALFPNNSNNTDVVAAIGATNNIVYCTIDSLGVYKNCRGSNYPLYTTLQFVYSLAVYY